MHRAREDVIASTESRGDWQRCRLCLRAAHDRNKAGEIIARAASKILYSSMAAEIMASRNAETAAALQSAIKSSK